MVRPEPSVHRTGFGVFIQHYHVLDVFPQHGNRAEILDGFTLVGTTAIIGVQSEQGLQNGQMGLFVFKHLDIFTGSG